MKSLKNDLRRWTRLAFHPLLNERGAVGSGDDKDDQKLTFEIDGEEKTFTPEDVQNLLSQQASATQKTQTVAEVLQAAERYGVSVDQYMQNAEGSFGVMTKLMDAGIIDDKGNILEKQGPAPIETPPGGSTPPGGLPTPPVAKGDKVFETAMKAMVDPLVDRLDRLSQDNVTLMRLRLGDNILAKFTNLTDEDVSAVFSVAERDQSKTLMQFAEERSNQKTNDTAATEEAFAKKYGVDLEKHKADLAFEQDPSGGAGVMFSKKKFAFQKKKGEEGTVTPVEATKRFLNKFEGFKA